MASDLPWRQRLEDWPDLWRERWGRRANAIEEAGCDWLEAERQAWNEVHVEKREAETATPDVLARVGRETQGLLREAG